MRDEKFLHLLGHNMFELISRHVKPGALLAKKMFASEFFQVHRQQLERKAFTCNNHVWQQLICGLSSQ